MSNINSQMSQKERGKSESVLQARGGGGVVKAPRKHDVAVGRNSTMSNYSQISMKRKNKEIQRERALLASQLHVTGVDINTQDLYQLHKTSSTMLKGTQTQFKDDKEAREYQAILMKPIVFNEDGLKPGT